MKRYILFIALLIITKFSWSQKTYLQWEIEGNKEKETFNLKHRIKSEIATIYKRKGKKIKKDRVDYESIFNKHGKTILYKEYWKKNQNRNRTHYFKYDNNQRLIEHKEKSDYLFTDYLEQDNIKYNEDTTQILIDRFWNSYNIFGKNNYTIKSKRNFLINSRNQISAEINQKNDTIYFNYNEKGLFSNKSKLRNDTIKQALYDKEWNQTEFNYHEVEIYKYQYDNKGNCIKSVSSEFDKKEEKYIIYEWRKLKYDENNKLIEVHIYDNQNKLKSTFKYSYDGELKKHKEYFNEKNQSLKLIKYEYTFY